MTEDESAGENPEAAAVEKRGGRGAGKAGQKSSGGGFEAVAAAAASARAREARERAREEDEPPRGPEREQLPAASTSSVDFGPGTIQPPMPMEWQRLAQALQDIAWNRDSKKSVWSEWEQTPPELQRNPLYLHSMLISRGMDAYKASYVVQRVFRQEPQFAQPQQPWPYPVYPGQPTAAPGQAPVDEGDKVDDRIDRWMEELMRMIRMKNMAALMGTAMGGAEGGSPVIEMRPKLDAEGKVVYGPGGQVEYEYIPRTAAALPAVQMAQAYQRGEAVDPTKLMESMVNVFRTGVEVARVDSGGNQAQAQQTEVLRQQLEQARLNELKAHFVAQERAFSAEREAFLQRIEQMSPEKVADQMAKWKAAGLVGGNQDLEQLKLQMRYDMFKQERMDRKEAELEKIRAQAAEAQQGREQFKDLIELGKSALTDSLSPVLKAVGDGLQQRIAMGGGAPAPAPPPQQGGSTAPAGAPAPGGQARAMDYSRMSPEERQAWLNKVVDLEQKVAIEKRKILDAGTSSGSSSGSTTQTQSSQGGIAPQQFPPPA